MENKQKTKINQVEILEQLRNFSGTELYHRYSPQLFPWFFLTDGAYYVAESCEAHWLFDYIASNQYRPCIKKHPKLKRMQFWTLEVEGSKGKIRCEWDKGQVVHRETIPYTDFPLATMRIWVAPTTITPSGQLLDKVHLVAMLPQEY